MTEVWLKQNRRAVLMGMLFPIVAELIGLTIATVGWFAPQTVLFWIGTTIFVLAQMALIGVAAHAATPRIAYRDGNLYLYVRSGGPVRVPIGVVEGFLLGQGPTMLPGQTHDWETSTLVMKLADKAEEFRQVESKPALASWCNSYVTFRGTWCEPLNIEVVTRLNTRLGAIRAERKSA